MKTIHKRQFTRALNLPEDRFDRPALLRDLFGPHKLIVMVGLPCTGKTTTLQEYEHPNKHLTKWSRQPIFEMLFSDGVRDEKYNSYLSTLEAEMFPSLFIRDFHQVCVDGWNRVRSARAHFLGLMPKGSGTTLACVMDGPQHRIVERMAHDPRYSQFSDADNDDRVCSMIRSTDWPRFEEGFDEIVYLNTFGAEGVEHLRAHVLPRNQ